MFFRLFLRKEIGRTFTELSESFKGKSTETWMNENLIKTEKPELVKKVERYLGREAKKIIQEQIKEENNDKSFSTTQHTTLDNWDKR